LLIGKAAVVKISVYAAVAIACLLLASSGLPLVKTERMADFPQTMLWAWERPEDLRFLDSRSVGVAYLAQTLRWQSGRLQVVPRRQPLIVAENTRLIAVTRFETGGRYRLSSGWTDEIVRRLLLTLDKPHVAAIQIDFDAKVSERAAYRRLLQDLRAALPDSVPLSISALASFCLGDPWLKDLPVDEVVPMLFRMGEDSASIKQFVAQGGDFSVPLCRNSYGVALDEPLAEHFAGQRRIYVFNPRPQAWDAATVGRLGLNVVDDAEKSGVYILNGHVYGFYTLS